jgi:hypothetical protein
MAGATCAMATMAAAHAEAGTYHVLACSDLGSTTAVVPNNAWTQVPANAPTGLEAFVACPSMRGDRRDGIAAQDHTPGPFRVDAGAEVFWRFAAPPGTSIAGISVARSLGKAGAQPWRPYGRADGAVFDTCDIASGQDVCENTGNATFAINDASTIDYGVRCDTPSAQCTSGSSLHAVWMSLYAADVLVTDPSAPTLTGGPSGPLWNADGYHRATESASFGGTDNTGIAEADWLVDGRQQTFDRGGCDYSRPRPCPDMLPDTQHSMNMAAVPDGQHQLQALVKDAAGNPATAGPINLNIDNTPPAGPGRLTAVPAGGGFTASWTNPDGQFAPITKAHYKLCPVGSRAGPCQDEQTATGTNISSITGLRLPGPGTWGLTVWLEDAAGNVGTANIAPLILGPAHTSAGITLAKAKLDRHHRLAVRGKAGNQLTTKLEIRYRYRPGKHHQLRSINKSAVVHRGAYVAHLKLPRAARRIHKGTLTVSYPGDATHPPAKLNQRVTLPRR